MKALALILMLSLGLMASHAEAGKPKVRSYHTKKYPRKHGKGLKKKKKRMQGMKHAELPQGVAIPGSVDLSPLVSLPFDQGSCGSCWDMALTKALRSQYMLQGKDPGTLEFNYLLNNCGAGPQMDGCNGGDFAAAQSFEGFQGPGLNALNPYRAVMGKCKGLPVEATAVSYSMLGSTSKGPTFYDLAYAMGVEKHMLATDVAAGQGEWETYSDGVYNDCVGTQNDIDHMINLVGFSCETSVDASNHCIFDSEGKPINGDGYLIVQNHWGEDWGTKAANGHGGYMKTRMYGADGSKCNAIGTEALMFTVNPGYPPKPQPTPPKPPTPPAPPVPPAPAPCKGWLCCWFGIGC